MRHIDRKIKFKMGHSVSVTHTTNRCEEEVILARGHPRRRTLQKSPDRRKTCQMQMLVTVALLACFSTTSVQAFSTTTKITHERKANNLQLWQTKTADLELKQRRRRKPGLRSRPVPPPVSLLRSTPYEYEDDDEHVRRKLEFAARYTDVDTLRRTFGTNKNKLWGDFDAETTRKLYHVLLPRAMLELYRIEGQLRPQELAPLAFEARVAAKKYARERCVVPGRLFSMAFDGFRSLKNYGKWSAEGLSWEQIWHKYESEVLSENFVEDDMHALTHQVCLKILEKSCASNPLMDKMFLTDDINPFAEQDVARIAQILDQEMQELLQMDEAQNATDTFIQQTYSDNNSLENNRIFKLTPQAVAALRFLLQTKKQLLPPRPNSERIWNPQSKQALPKRQRKQRMV